MAKFHPVVVKGEKAVEAALLEGNEMVIDKAVDVFAVASEIGRSCLSIIAFLRSDFKYNMFYKCKNVFNYFPLYPVMGDHFLICADYLQY